MLIIYMKYEIGRNTHEKHRYTIAVEEKEEFWQPPFEPEKRHLSESRSRDIGRIFTNVQIKSTLRGLDSMSINRSGNTDKVPVYRA